MLRGARVCIDWQTSISLLNPRAYSHVVRTRPPHWDTGTSEPTFVTTRCVNTAVAPKSCGPPSPTSGSRTRLTLLTNLRPAPILPHHQAVLSRLRPLSADRESPLRHLANDS